MSLGLFASSLIERYAAGSLPSFVARRVARRVHRDESWARRYHELRVIERALPSSSAASPSTSSTSSTSSASSASSLSRTQLDAITARVLDVTASQSSSPSPSHAPKSSVRPWLAFAGAAACAVVVLVVVARPKQDDLRARGPTSTKQGLHVRCLVRDALVSEADIALDGERVALKCAKGALLAFSATNTSSKAIAISLKLDGDKIEEPPAQPGAVDAPLANGVRLDEGAHAIEVLANGAVAAHLDVEVSP